MTNKKPIPEDIQRLLEGRHHDPFEILGQHSVGNSTVIRALIPDAAEVIISGAQKNSSQKMQRLFDSDLFEWLGDQNELSLPIKLLWHNGRGNDFSAYHPYCFAPQISDYDLHLFSQGKHQQAYEFLGSHPHVTEGIEGVLFATWAPNAQRISVVGDFNRWDGRAHTMRARGASGIWEIFIPGLSTGALYKFEISSKHNVAINLKTDPYGQHFELRPNTASIVPPQNHYQWQDKKWLQLREKTNWLHEPMSVYEVHLGSWQRNENGGFISYKELAHRLVTHVKHLGFTHIELMPITEHPLDASWGYQVTGYFAPTSRFGSPDDFRYFIDHCHQHNIGVLLDWVPAHFPKDQHGLANFDGAALYEYEDPRKGEHRDWGTLIFNYGRNEVKNFLISSAVYWIKEMHIDGLRVDAVASMLYLDYSREDGDWIPNQFGGRENLEAVDFLRQLNEVTHDKFPGTMIIAEESTSWPMVSRPTSLGGLGFSQKWNMGWMHDTLEYMSKEPVHRQHHHDMLTFSQLYAYTENFMLPFSHDEVVHMKKSILHKMPGDEWQQFANLRLLYSYMFTHPGKKLLFMGCEFAQGEEWNHEQQLQWHVLDYPLHRGIFTLIRDLNKLYREQDELHHYDFDSQGFEWIDCHDSSQSILSFLRKSGDNFVVVVFNFTPVPRTNYRIGVPVSGQYEELFNSDSEHYGGSNLGNNGSVVAEDKAWMSQPCSLTLTLPPLAAVVLRPSR